MLVLCKECGKPIRSSRLEDHMARTHVITKELMSDGRRLITVPPGLRVHGPKKKNREEAIKCPVCSTTTAIVNLARHMAEVHGKAFSPQHFRKPAGLLPAQSSSAGLIEHSGEDIFDRGMVYSGGGYGLGKNRRH